MHPTTLPPLQDPFMTIEDYVRSRKQDDDLGLLDMKTGRCFDFCVLVSCEPSGLCSCSSHPLPYVWLVWQRTTRPRRNLGEALLPQLSGTKLDMGPLQMRGVPVCPSHEVHGQHTEEAGLSGTHVSGEWGCISPMQRVVPL